MPTWTGNGTTNNWSESANWDTGVPTATTAAIFNGVAPNGNKNCTITLNATCANLDFTGYSGEINFANNLTVRGSITLAITMTFTGSSGMILNHTGAVTYTSNGVAFNRPLLTTQNGGGGFIMTFVGDWVVSSFILTQIGANPFQIQGTGIMTVNGNFSIGQSMLNSTMTFKIATISTLSTPGGFGSFGGTLNLDSGSDTITITDFRVGTSTINYISGNINHTGVFNSNGNCNLNLQNVAFNNFAQAGNTTCTLVSDANFNNVTIGWATSGTGVILNGGIMRCRGNFSFGQINGNGSGTAKILLVGSGTINFTSINTFFNDFEINTSGSYTITSNTRFRSFKRINGSVTAGLFTAIFAAGAILDTAGIDWYNVTLNGNGTYELVSLLTVTDTLNCLGTTTFTGSYGFTTKTFNAQTAASILTFQNINANPLAEYRITGNVTIIGTSLSRITLQSAGSATFVATANGTSLTKSSGVDPSIGMVVSQTTGTAPAGLLALFPNRPVITGVVVPSLNFTLDLNVTPSTGSISMRAGYKAVFILENNGVATQNVAYTTCQDIDSSLGQPILSFASNNDDQATNVSLFRTINWGSLDPPPVLGRNFASVYVY